MGIKLIAIDMDGTLLAPDKSVSERNCAAIRAAEAAGIRVVIATGRRHVYAMQSLRSVGLPKETYLLSSNGVVTRLVGSELVHRMHLSKETLDWLLEVLGAYRDLIVLTFDQVNSDGEDGRGALIVERLDLLHQSINRWMTLNAPYIKQVERMEDAVLDELPIQMMVCGRMDAMRAAERLLLERGAEDRVSMHRTEYPERDLIILDILPYGCSKGAALLQLGESLKIRPEEMMAIGDNWNDLAMFDVVGRVALMGNAPENLKELGRERGWWVVGSHEADGVAEAIEDVLELESVRLK